jgi:hypothetical protein
MAEGRKSVEKEHRTAAEIDRTADSRQIEQDHTSVGVRGATEENENVDSLTWQDHSVITGLPRRYLMSSYNRDPIADQNCLHMAPRHLYVHLNLGLRHWTAQSVMHRHCSRSWEREEEE